ncbi:MAG TPA: hypothetical protein VHE81_00530 [Lacipirellulaceae bacterium]|nr:hypothetical protein [Lacipirellulaceae bacterium]
MYASVPSRHVPYSWLVRYCGRASGLIIVVSWLALVLAETLRSGMPVLSNYYQAAMLAIVFIGYAVGWRHEVLGGALAIVGTIGFLTLYIAMFEALPPTGALCFAIPGVLYLIAHLLDKRPSEQLSRQA